MGRIILAVLLLAPSILWDYFTWMIRYSKHPENTPLLKRYKKCRDLVCHAIRRLRIQPIILGEENIVDGSACYIGNHLSALDCLPLFYAFKNKPISFVAKIEVSKIPFVSKVFKSSDGLFLDRNDLRQGLKVMAKVQESLANNKTNYCIFAEGTRNQDQMKLILPFHHGTFRAPMKARVPIVPIVNYGSFTGLSGKHRWKKYPTITKFLKPIMPEEYEGKSTEEVAQMVAEIVQKDLSFNLRREYHKLICDNRYKDYSPYEIY